LRNHAIDDHGDAGSLGYGGEILMLVGWRTSTGQAEARPIILLPHEGLLRYRRDGAADLVAAAFVQARDTAHLSKLQRMGENIFREKVCKHDLRFASGVMLTAQY
jgi:hypothetical protein